MLLSEQTHRRLIVILGGGDLILIVIVLVTPDLDSHEHIHCWCKKKRMRPGRFKYKHAELTLPLLLCALPPCQSVPQERGKLIFAPLTRINFDKSVHKNAALLPKVGKLHPPTEVSHKIIVWLKNQTHAGLQ